MTDEPTRGLEDQPLVVAEGVHSAGHELAASQLTLTFGLQSLDSTEHLELLEVLQRGTNPRGVEISAIHRPASLGRQSPDSPGRNGARRRRPPRHAGAMGARVTSGNCGGRMPTVVSRAIAAMTIPRRVGSSDTTAVTR